MSCITFGLNKGVVQYFWHEQGCGALLLGINKGVVQYFGLNKGVVQYFLT